MNPKPPVFDDINFWPFLEILVIFCYNRHYEFEGDLGLESVGIFFFLVILHILKNICAKFQLVIIFGGVSVRIDRTSRLSEETKFSAVQKRPNGHSA